MCADSSGSDVLEATSYSHWWPLFRSTALRSELLPLPEAFLSFLEEDGVFLGSESAALPARHEPCIYSVDDEDAYRDWASSSDDEPDAAQRNGSGSSSSDDGAVADTRPWAMRFPEVHRAIMNATRELGGRVVPKLNWSCPSDAAWVNPSTTLDCKNADEVVLMLKSSDRVASDIEILRSLRMNVERHAAHGTSSGRSDGLPGAGRESAEVAGASSDVPSVAQDTEHQVHEEASTSQPGLSPVLVLRKWYDLRPEREFRCFVRRRTIVGVCQRDVSQHFPQLSEEEDTLTHIKAAVTRFHERHVVHRFPLSNYVLDLYVATDLTVKVVDFGEFGGRTSPLLFTWEELSGTGAGDGAPANASVGRADVDSDGAGTQGSGLDANWQLRILPPGGGMHVSMRTACAMPYDMLNLQESLDGIMQRMQNEQQQQQR